MYGMDFHTSPYVILEKKYDNEVKAHNMTKLQLQDTAFSLSNRITALSSFEGRYNKATVEIAEKDERIQELELQLKSQQESFQQVLMNYTVLEADLDKAEIDLKKEKSKLKEAQCLMEMKEQDNNELKEKMNREEEKHREELEKKVQEMEEEMDNKLEEEWLANQEKIAEISKDKDEQIKILENKCTEGQNHMVQYRDQLNKATKEIQSLKNYNREVSALKQRLSTELHQAKGEIEDLKKRHQKSKDCLQGENWELKLKLEETQLHCSDNATLLEKERKKNIEYHASVKQYSGELVSKETEIQKLKDELAKTQESLEKREKDTAQDKSELKASREYIESLLAKQKMDEQRLGDIYTKVIKAKDVSILKLTSELAEAKNSITGALQKKDQEINGLHIELGKLYMQTVKMEKSQEQKSGFRRRKDSDEEEELVDKMEKMKMCGVCGEDKCHH